jgi:type II secretory pathway component GspD/PulD (secretin)
LTLEDDQGETTSLTIPREDVAFELGESRGRATILMRPSLTVVNGEESVVFVGNNIPVPVGNSAAAGTTEDANDNRSFPSTRQRIERQDVGIELRVKPTTGSGGMVTLEFDLDLSALGVSAAGDVDRVGPTFMNRSINSKLRLFENEYAIIGAGSEVGEDEIRSGIPFLMKIPLLGQFFRSTSKSSVTSDLIAVVKARILRSPEEDAAEAIRRRIALERAVARTPDLNAPGENPFALLLETFRREEAAAEVVEAFREDGFETRVTSWLASDGKLWDVYLTGFPSFEEAAGLARGLSEAGWSPEVEVLSPENELAGD